MGCRIKTPTMDYQSSAIQLLKEWFERERRHGREVRTSMLNNFYIKFLERESALCKAQLVHVGQQAASIK